VANDGYYICAISQYRLKRRFALVLALPCPRATTIREELEPIVNMDEYMIHKFYW
jgi:hypothetical protein